MKDGASGHVYSSTPGQGQHSSGRGHRVPPPPTPIPGRSAVTREALHKACTHGTRRLPLTGESSPLGFSENREQVPSGTSSDLRLRTARPGQALPGKQAEGEARAAELRVPGTQGTLERPSLPDQRTLRSSPVTRRLARRARAYMAPLHSAGCNADRQLTGRI